MFTSSSSSSQSAVNKDVAMLDCLGSDEHNTMSSYYGPFKGYLELPTHWSSKDKEKSANLDLNANSLRVTYKAQKEGNEAGLVRANQPIPPACGIYYFEVKVISKGKDGYIGIGVCTANILATRLPGWDRNSYGYHGDDGHFFNGDGTGKTYGPTYTTNDVVGCCINFVHNTMFFTKNGVPLGEFANEIKGFPIYPCVGLRTLGESVEVNFGQKSFVFEIAQLFKEERLKIYKNLQVTPNEEMTSTQLVLGYLMHYGYPETVKLFVNATGINDNSLEAQLDDLKNRQKISDYLKNGHIDRVIEELNRLYPEFLLKRRDMLFKLYCQKFIEMIKIAPENDTLDFGKELYKFIHESPENELMLKEVFLLIAYNDPYSSPVSYLMQPSRRDPIVKDLNRALLVYCNKPSTPVLKQIVKQVKVVVDEVVINNAAPSAIFMNLNEFIEHDGSEDGMKCIATSRR